MRPTSPKAVLRSKSQGTTCAREIPAFSENGFGEARRTVGAVAPTGRIIARTMAAHRPARIPIFPCLNSGPGTGAIHGAILEHGIPADSLVSVEYSEKFCAYLSARFPGVHFIHGDAFDLATTLAGTPWRRFGAVISGLPLLNFPKPARAKLIEDSLSLCEPGAPFVQFSYGPRAARARRQGPVHG